MKRKNIHCFSTTEDAVAPTHTLLKKGDVVLLKGSRGMKLEQIINTF
jgi:UDP-N-acetylmuramyl pentapeptide synthase